jgi:hypothetical protein
MYQYSKDCVYKSEIITFYIDDVEYKLYDIEDVLGTNLPSKHCKDLIKNSQYLII